MRDVSGGQPLRLRRTADGLAVYAVGEFKRYAGTARDPDSTTNLDRECAFRLCNATDRRQVRKTE
jgi:hypothetical protein